MRQLAALLLFLCSMTMSAEDYTPAQEALRSRISAFLRSEGYKPEMQDDGLKFKDNGTTYYVEIDSNNEDPMYLSLSTYLAYEGNHTREKIAKRLNKCNVKYAVKVRCLKSSIVVASEMFLTKASQFTDAFSSMFSQLKSGVELVEEED